MHKGSASCRLGFSGEDGGYCVDLGYPDPYYPFPLDPAIKLEAMWTGELPTRASLFAERRGPMVRLRSARTGEWRESVSDLPEFNSMITHAAEPGFSPFASGCAAGASTTPCAPTRRRRCAARS